jgi:hypothetical protein
MAGRLVVSTLNDDTGVLATQNGMRGIAKAWVDFTNTGTINASFNVSSITVNSTGDYTINFTTAFPNANYVTMATTQCDTASLGAGTWFFGMRSTSGTPTTKTTTTARMLTSAANGALSGSAVNSVAFISS